MTKQERRVREAETEGRPGRVGDRSEVAEAIRELREVRKGVRLGGLDWRRLRDEGRR